MTRFAVLTPTNCLTLTCAECGTLIFVSVGPSDLRSLSKEIDAELQRHTCPLVDRNGKAVNVTRRQI